jgi:hypothetical protein
LKYRVIDLATEQRKHQAQAWLESFRRQSQRAIEREISRWLEVRLVEEAAVFWASGQAEEEEEGCFLF